MRLALIALEKQMDKLREHFGLEPEDLNIDLGHARPAAAR
jgi:hypothetical protein